MEGILVLNRGDFPEEVTLEWGRDKKGRGHEVETNTAQHHGYMPRGEGGVVGMCGRGHLWIGLEMG